MKADADVAIIVDASAVGALSLKDEAHLIDAGLTARLLSSSWLVPAHWRLEVANLLRTARRRERIDLGERDTILRGLGGLNVETDRSTGEHAWAETLRLSDKHGLTPYDAAYLELARRRGAALATLDRPLARAADAEQLNLFIPA
jgi:predicted nucleic acid-binding protein